MSDIHEAYKTWRDPSVDSLADLIAAAEELPDSCRADVVQRIGEWTIKNVGIVTALVEIAREQKIYKGHGDYDIAPALTADEAMMRARRALAGVTP